MAKNTGHDMQHNGDRSPEALRQAIRRTRGEMDRTLDELGKRLSPQHLVDEVTDFIKHPSSHGATTERAIDIGRKVAGEIKRNPLPSLLIGAGLVWQLVQSGAEETPPMRHGVYQPGFGEKLGEAKERAGETASGIAGQARSTVEGVKEQASHAGQKMSEITGQMRQQASRAGEQARSGYRYAHRQVLSASDSLGSAIRDYPLATGVGSLALGLLAGMLLPQTETENKLLGKESEELKERAREAGRETVERGKEVSREVTGKMEEPRGGGVKPSDISAVAQDLKSELSRERDKPEKGTVF